MSEITIPMDSVKSVVERIPLTAETLALLLSQVSNRVRADAKVVGVDWDSPNNMLYVHIDRAGVPAAYWTQTHYNNILEALEAGESL